MKTSCIALCALSLFLATPVFAGEPATVGAVATESGATGVLKTCKVILRLHNATDDQLFVALTPLGRYEGEDANIIDGSTSFGRSNVFYLPIAAAGATTEGDMRLLGGACESVKQIKVVPDCQRPQLAVGECLNLVTGAPDSTIPIHFVESLEGPWPELAN